MIAKWTANQLTLPDSLMDALGHPTDVDVEMHDGKLIVAPRPRGFDEDIPADIHRNT